MSKPNHRIRPGSISHRRAIEAKGARVIDPRAKSTLTPEQIAWNKLVAERKKK